MRRLGLLTLAAATAALAAAPSTASAAHPCIAQPSYENCRDLGSDVAHQWGGSKLGGLYDWATHPEDWIQCVRECGPPD